MPETKVDLKSYDNSWYNPGRSLLIRGVWHFLNSLFLGSKWIPSSALRQLLLKLFGARIGRGVVLKPGISVKYPWNLSIGNYSWIGENAWLDSLGQIEIGSNVCVSQGVYLCTGNHDWSKSTFDLIVKDILVSDGAWIGAKSIILPGVIVGRFSVISAGSVVTSNCPENMICSGNPATPIKARWPETTD